MLNETRLLAGMTGAPVPKYSKFKLANSPWSEITGITIHSKNNRKGDGRIHRVV